MFCEAEEFDTAQELNSGHAPDAILGAGDLLDDFVASACANNDASPAHNVADATAAAPAPVSLSAIGGPGGAAATHDDAAASSAMQHFLRDAQAQVEDPQAWDFASVLDPEHDGTGSGRCDAVVLWHLRDGPVAWMSWRRWH